MSDREKHDHQDAPGDGDWLLPEDSREHLRTAFAEMPAPVTVEVFTREGDNDPYNEAVTKFLKDVDRLGEKITVNHNGLDGDKAKAYGVDRSPTLLVEPDRFRLRYTGAPLGEEARVFIEILLLASQGKSGLSEASRGFLAELDEPRDVRVFISPTCPYCPGQVSLAMRAALERPDLVSAECVETGENQDLAEKFDARSVPLTVTNGTFRQNGLLPEERFVLELVHLKDAEELLKEFEGREDNPVPQAEAAPAGAYDVIVAGGGPAGLTAGIYAERSGLKTLVLEKNVLGGQVVLTPEVENYPGFRQVGGQKLVEMMAEQARVYCTIHEGEGLTELKIGKAIEVFTSKGRYTAKALVLATGASAKRLGVPGENRFFGQGVSVCASCDGWAYKGKDVVMVGGGNTALTEALHLHAMGVNVTIMHRRGEFRAEKHLRNAVDRAGIKVVWNTVVLSFEGGDDGLSAVRVRNVETGEESEIKTDGVFLAIGWNPDTELAEQVGLALDQWGYIKVDRSMRTSIPRIYACGDVVGGVQQIATAVGEGATAALALFEDISNPYWTRAE
ncbi:FAD-dependent oxidoreductase [Desulfocurvus sp. DL9XJH121]